MVATHIFHNYEKYVEYAAGQTIFDSGDEAKCMYVVKEGEIELRVSGRIITLGECEIFGEMAIVEHKPRLGSAIAKTDCKLVELDEKDFVFLVTQTPYFALQVMQTISERLREASENTCK